MCSRFENKESGLSIFKRIQKDFHGEIIFDIDEDETFPMDKIAPTNKIITIRRLDEKLKIQPTQWGIKFDETKKFPLVFNSRLETIIAKKFWMTLFKNNRCLIPATAFFEWIEVDGKKIPQRISSDIDLFFIAGINFIKDDNIFSSMITTTPNKFMKDIHNRMPVLLHEERALEFLFANEEDALKMCSEEVKMNLGNTEHKF